MITKQDLIEQREQMQEDLLCLLDGLKDPHVILDGLNSNLEAAGCQVIVDGMNLLIAKEE